MKINYFELNLDQQDTIILYYRHLLVINPSSYDVFIYYGLQKIGKIPANTQLELFDLIPENTTKFDDKKFLSEGYKITFQPTSSGVIIDVYNYGGKD